MNFPTHNKLASLFDCLLSVQRVHWRNEGRKGGERGWLVNQLYACYVDCNKTQWQRHIFLLKRIRRMLHLGDKIDNEMAGRRVREGHGKGGVGKAGAAGCWVASKMENRLRVCRLQHARVS